MYQGLLFSGRQQQSFMVLSSLLVPLLLSYLMTQVRIQIRMMSLACLSDLCRTTKRLQTEGIHSLQDFPKKVFPVDMFFGGILYRSKKSQ